MMLEGAVEEIFRTERVLTDEVIGQVFNDQRRRAGVNEVSRLADPCDALIRRDGDENPVPRDMGVDAFNAMLVHVYAAAEGARSRDRNRSPYCAQKPSSAAAN